ncbi:hypothetical protein L596_017446 [Steinernema carpocapsae]|uniref:Uncharacterized protein n=1 Tax=Steinernema carpocapsae TaxID=34508 RepID=A0A4U5N1P5_STECR|nr:hypothetical protein L596_017446 [Steinernema carpocapsae]
MEMALSVYYNLKEQCQKYFQQPEKAPSICPQTTFDTSTFIQMSILITHFLVSPHYSMPLTALGTTDHKFKIDSHAAKSNAD